MKDLITRAKKVIKEDKGVAMTEVLVAFLILMMCLGMLYTCMRLSSNMIMKAADIDKNHAEYQKNLEETLTTSSYPTTATGSVTYTFQSGYTITMNTANLEVTDDSGDTVNVPVFVEVDD